MEFENGFIEDIEALEQASVTKRTLIDTKKRLGMVLDLLPVGLLIHQEQGILFANKTACRILEKSQETLIGQHFLDFAYAPNMKALNEFFAHSFSTDIIQQINDVEITNRAGEKRLFHAIGATLPWEGTKVAQIVLRDITEEREKEHLLEKLSATDPLTGACNRRGFIRYAEQLCNSDHGSPCGLIFYDVDHFKAVNDIHGHAAGDIALREIVLRTQNVLTAFAKSRQPNKPAAILARMGGEEFAIILPEASEERTALLAERVRQEIASRPMGNIDATFDVRISLGVATGDLARNPIDDVLRDADIGLYAAKKAGRNQVVLSKDVEARETEAPYQPISRQLGRASG